jgi:murein DD-endopeptidase MepM/ murein hydrolase activator NlpD
MKPPFNLVVVPGDGSRVLRFSVPRWVAYGALGLESVVLAAMVGFSGDYALLSRQSGQMETLRQRADDQRAVIDAFEMRLPAIRSEITDWKALHAKMWKAFGPEASSKQTPTGIGGAALAAEAPAAGVALQPAEELELLASGVAEEGPRLRELERVVSRTGRIVRTLPLRWPIRGTVNSEYGMRRSPWNGMPEHHDGIDIGSPAGTPVKSPAPGTVVAASSHGDFGRHVTLDHGNGMRSLYGHLAAVDVKPGQRVEKGQVIGLVGSTGRSTGPHLHYQLLVDGKSINPRGFLSER